MFLSNEFHIFTVNAGSSSIKFALFKMGEPMHPLMRGEIERIGLPNTTFKINSENEGENSSRIVTTSDFLSAINLLMDWLEAKEYTISAIGHRVVHGGAKYHKPQRIMQTMLKELERLSSFDPEHLPNEILLIRAFQQRFFNLPQIACFDTAFHADLPRVAQLLSIPRRYFTQEVKRYGFHGLSYAFLMEALTRAAGAEAAQGRIILAHLGNGASLAAVHGGKSIDTSMGFTSAAGVPMSTRSGDLDPGLIGYFVRQENMRIEQFDHMVHFESGLLGISETSSDIRDLLERAASDIRAEEAVMFFCYQVKKWIGALAAALGGVETLIFSAGIGEHQPEIREKICSGLEFLGITLDTEKNSNNANIISIEESRVVVRVIHSDEEQMIAQSVVQLLKKCN